MRDMERDVEGTTSGGNPTGIEAAALMIMSGCRTCAVGGRRGGAGRVGPPATGVVA